MTIHPARLCRLSVYNGSSSSSSSKPQQQLSVAEEDVYSTFVPRNPGVTDWQWNNTDAAIVKMAGAAAEKAVITKNIDETGVIWHELLLTG